MAAAGVTGNGPVSFTGSDGKQIQIPLTEAYFAADGTLLTTGALVATLSAADKTIAQQLVDDLVLDGLLRSAVSPPPKPAFLVKAASPGVAGNGVSIGIDHVDSGGHNDPTLTTFDVTIADASDNHVALDLTTIQQIPSGLVEFDSSVPEGANLPTNNIYVVSAGTPIVSVLDGSNTGAFQLKINNPTSATVVTISSDAAKPGTFNMSAVRKITALTASTLTNMTTLAPSLKTTAPSGGFSVPAAGTTQLSGGTESTAASAIVFAD